MHRSIKEAVETIVGDLCRAEDGRFANCEGGGAAVAELDRDSPETSSTTVVAKPSVRGADKLKESTRAKVARRAPGKGGKADLTADELKDVVEHGVYGIIGAGPSPAERADPSFVWSDAKEAERRDLIHDDLRRDGYVYTDGEGRYGAPERTILVLAPEIEPTRLDALGEKYGQESVVYVAPDGTNQLRFTTGPNKGKRHHGNGFSRLPDDATADYSDFVSTDGRHFKFTLDFDWNVLHEIVRRMVAYLTEIVAGTKRPVYKKSHERRSL
jgi:hypothetical protein